MHLKGTPSVGDVLGNKAINYIAYAPNIDVKSSLCLVERISGN